MESLFYRIDHKSNMKVFDNETLIQIKSFLFCELASNEELFIGNGVTIANLFKKLIHFTHVDIENEQQKKLEQMFKLTEQYNQSIGVSNETTTQEIFSLCQRVALRNYKMTFTFTAEFVKEIATLLSSSYSKLNILKQQYKLSYKELLSNLQAISNENIDLITKFRQVNLNKKDIEDEFLIPNEMILLMNIFQKIKKLVMCLEEKSDLYLKGCLLILMNAEWLFPYVFEIEFDLTCEKVFKNSLKYFHGRIQNTTKNKKRKLSYDPKVSIYNDNMKKERNENDYEDIVKSNQDVFDLIIIYTHFITQFPYLNNLNIVFPTSFKSEIETLLKNTDINNNDKKEETKDNIDEHKNDINNNNTTFDFHFFDFLLSINHLRTLNITFNSLERESFEKLLSVIQNNSTLNTLSINFFINNEEYYTSKSLLKIAEENRINVNTILNQCTYTFDDNDQNNMLNLMLINKLITHFESNIEKLFLIIQSKKNLNSLTLCFNLPSVIENNDKYFFIFMKLIFNIFLMLNREKFHMKELKIIAPLLKFHNKPLINNFLQGINLYNKNKSLTMYHFQVDMSSIVNITNILSKNLTFLYLGDLDVEIFQSFINLYQSDNFIKESQLETVCVSLRKSIVDFEKGSEIKEKVNTFFNGKNPHTVREIEFYSQLKMKLIDLEEMLNFVNGNNIMKYTLQIQKESQIEFLKFKYEKYFYFSEKVKKEIKDLLIIGKKLRGANKYKRYLLGNILSFIVNIDFKDILILQ